MIENELIDSIVKLFERDMKRLIHEISSYPDEKSVWIVDGGIKNTAGNLCLHLCGNLQYYIGAVLGKSGYVRNRELEFSEKFRSKEELLNEMAETRTIVLTTLQNLDASTLATPYPENVLGYTMSHAYFLVHLYGHFNYHLGQINYHRRLLG